MSRIPFSNSQTRSDNYQAPSRDSLELASLASSPDSGPRSSCSSSPSGVSSSRKLSLDDEDPLSSSQLHPQSPSGRPRSARSYSVSSAFDFGATLFPLSQTTGGYAPLGAPSALDGEAGLADGSLERNKTLTYLNGLSLVVGLVIGSGIFSSPSQVNVNAGSPGASLIAWVVAGLLAWTGAASYAELGGAIPLNGGSQVYLAKIFGELAGFLFTWCAVLVLKPGSAAIIAIIFGEYVVRAVVGAEVETINPWINKAVAFGGLMVVTLLNCISTRVAARIGDLFMFFKFVALLGVTIIGIVVAITGLSSTGSANKEWKAGWFEGTKIDVSAWALALYAGLWAFDGWDNTNYVTGEFKNPNRDLPRVIHTAMPLVILSYILANVAYILVLPQATIEASNTIAVQFGDKVFGHVGALIFALVVSASCFGALNATTFTSGRLVYAAGKEGYLPEVFGTLWTHDTTSTSRLQQRSWYSKSLSQLCGTGMRIGYTPINAMALNSALTVIYIVVGEFKTLVTFYGVAGYTFYFLTVLGLIVLRVREPYLQRPYKTWISTPIIFCCVSLFLLSRAVIAEPLQTLIVVAFIIAGVPVYYWRIYKRDGQKAKITTRSILFDCLSTMGSIQRWEQIVAKKRSLRDQKLEPYIIANKDQQRAPQVHRVHERTCLHKASVIQEITDIDNIPKLVEQLKSGQISAEQTTLAYIKRAVLAHQLTNCLTEVVFEKALTQARDLDREFQRTGKVRGPLHGVPVTLKDQFNIKGVDSTLGYVGRSFAPAAEDAILVQLLRNMGAVVLAKTNLPQSIMWAETENPLWGLTTNPRDPSLTPGGSTGGEAVLLALRGSILGFGTDIGGSVRIPQSLMGLYGLKPSSSRLPYHGVPVSTEGQEHVPSSIGPMGRDLSSLCYVSRALITAKPWVFDPNCPPLPWNEDAFRRIQSRPMVIGLIADDGVVKVHPPIERALRELSATLEAHGHELVPWDASDHLEYINLMDLFYTVDGGEDIRRDVGVAGEPYLPHVEALVNRGQAISVYDYWQLNKRKATLQKRYLDKWNATLAPSGKHVDILLAPTTPHPAIPHRSLRWVGYTKIWNFLDYPAVTFPVDRVRAEKDVLPTDYQPRNELDAWNWGLYDRKAMDGHPINLQVIGRKLEEEVVLGAASVVEALWRRVSKCN
ncbi:amino acid/polyamine transporter [Aspergillus saccharolyticus JOP 1030-1]|uniref:Amino acid/polyamine transporter n=1 Tax=Aspergillus saccharolyticus JOP 1030-1 TaxID=1450539 RepID=A0A318ZMS3_9EURO|nr:amino acid/polyamine transporter [Aspergillus saccharolyticus JOP 1030-1]PYH48277.1 amino acid/polyamine transporter [Aspergillus saccharolyticus JOP 1030-1]